ncbi:hypothetical protein SISNIDRAFT_431654 [Sistotremastrum niveocremeum HHB9708]|uniref:MYND-type domain-containing protein n=1 Tax=Sistotremastrum niveocremeum HHB9708 TaxID=1314777 RepID=A0A164QLU8_9AGAM|nr:hypothetical protein SISNIDRAFT_431654 [Sistotremastrum niveocremeum HHB9708]
MSRAAERRLLQFLKDILQPKYVKLHPDDLGTYLEEIILEDPDDFIPNRDPYGEARSWGLRPYDEDGNEWVDLMKIMNRRMYAQMMYMSWEPGYPEEQFVKALAIKKAEKLKAMDINDLRRRDFIIKISMPDIPSKFRTLDYVRTHLKKGALGDNLIYRRFKVSGGINLEALQDKVIQPVMGWERNLHAYVFMELTEGACFGPRNPSTVDVAHKGTICYDWLKADDYVLAHLVQKKGDKMEYLYDFGDRFLHWLEVEDVLPVEESDGAVVVLEGRGMCPAENSSGNRTWAGKMYSYYHGTPEEKQQVLREMNYAPNYKGKSIDGRYDLLRFSVDECQNDIAVALGSHSSVRSGGKQYVQQFYPGSLHFGGDRKKGQSISKTFDPETMCEDHPNYLQETISERRDRTKVALCAACGTPHDLKACSRCKTIWYCGSAHQKQHWRTHKPTCVPISKPT